MTDNELTQQIQDKREELFETETRLGALQIHRRNLEAEIKVFVKEQKRREKWAQKVNGNANTEQKD